MDVFNDDEEHRNDEDLENGGGKHTEYNGNPHFKAGICTCAGRESQRNVTHNESEGCHQDRAETDLRCFDSRLKRFHTMIRTNFRVLDDQDGVLRGQPDDGQETDLEVNVVIYMECQRAARLAPKKPVGIPKMTVNGTFQLS